MTKIVRVYDPAITSRNLLLGVKENACPGFLEFLSKLNYGTETPLIRAVAYQWFLKHNAAGTLNQAVQEALNGPGGLPADRSRTRAGRSANKATAAAIEPHAQSASGSVAVPALRPITHVDVAHSGAHIPAASNTQTSELSPAASSDSVSADDIAALEAFNSTLGI